MRNEWCVSRIGHPTAKFDDYVAALHFYLKVLAVDEIKPLLYHHLWAADNGEVSTKEGNTQGMIEDLCMKVAKFHDIRDWE